MSHIGSVLITLGVTAEAGATVHIDELPPCDGAGKQK